MAMAALGGVGEAGAAVAQRDPIVSTATVLADPGTSADLAEAPAAPAAVIMERWMNLSRRRTSVLLVALVSVGTTGLLAARSLRT